jgi:hypothetical protein
MLKMSAPDSSERVDRKSIVMGLCYARDLEVQGEVLAEEATAG